VLADEAMPPDTLNRAELDRELTEIEGNLPSLRDQAGRAAGPERETLMAELRQLERRQSVTRAKLQATNGPGGH